MPFLGLFWITSWLGVFFSPNQTLPNAPHDFATQPLDPAIATPPDPWQRLNSSAALTEFSFSPFFPNFRDRNRYSLERGFLEKKGFFATEPQAYERRLCPPEPDEQAEITERFPIPKWKSTYSIRIFPVLEPDAGDENSWQKAQQFAIGILGNRLGARQTPVEVNKIYQVKNHRRFAGAAVKRKNFALPKVPLKRVVYEIRVKGRAIAERTDAKTALAMAERIERWLQAPDFDAERLQPASIGGKPGSRAGDRVLFVLDEPTTEESNPELVAIRWVNNLRLALKLEPLALDRAQMQMHGLQNTDRSLAGLASWYGPYFHGRQTANQEIYNQHALTAAHVTLPFDTYLRVTNRNNGRSVVVRINDRGPYIEPRILDLSLQAARCLKIEQSGIAEIEAAIVEVPSQDEPVVERSPKDKEVSQL